MFQWLSDWWRDRRDRKRLAGRAIFRYFDGRRWRYADPFLLWRSLFHHPTVNLVDGLKLAEQGIEPAASECLAALTEVFGVTRWNAETRTGLTDWEVFALVLAFKGYLDSLKKSTSGGLTSTEPTATESLPSPTAPPEATSSSADSGSTTTG